MPLYALESRALITGQELADAQAQIDPTFNQAVVNFQLTRRGGRVFGRGTAENVGNYMAIILDGRVQGRPPVIRSQITRNGQIELGNSQIQDAQDLALVSTSWRAAGSQSKSSRKEPLDLALGRIPSKRVSAPVSSPSFWSLPLSDGITGLPVSLPSVGCCFTCCFRWAVWR